MSFEASGWERRSAEAAGCGASLPSTCRRRSARLSGSSPAQQRPWMPPGVSNRRWPLLVAIQKLHGTKVFLSHTWRTPGRWKVLALLLRSSGLCMLLCWLLCSVIVVVMYVAGVFPEPSLSTTIFVVGVPYRQPFRLGLLAVYLPAMLVGALSSSYLGCFSGHLCFLDVVCIHQTDEKLMLRGIYGLGGFLSRAKELRILWSEPHFTRSGPPKEALKLFLFPRPVPL